MAKRTHKAPGKAYREGITLLELGELFPDEEAARKWFEAQVWPRERCCTRCGSLKTQEASHRKMPYWCTDCRSYFSLKTGTALESSKIPLKKWVWAIYLHLTKPQGRVVREARSRHRRKPEDGLAHAPPHSRDVGSEA